MSSGDPGSENFWASVQIPDDTDPWSASSYSPGLSEVTDRTRWLGQFTGVGSVFPSTQAWGANFTGAGGTQNLTLGAQGIIGVGGTNCCGGVFIGNGLGCGITSMADTGALALRPPPNVGVLGYGGSTGGAGIYGWALGGDAPGVFGHAEGSGNGVVGQADLTGAGGYFTGGSTSGAGVWGVAQAGAGRGVVGEGFGAGAGVYGLGGASGIGGWFTGQGIACGCLGIGGTGGATVGPGVVGIGGGTTPPPVGIIQGIGVYGGGGTGGDFCGVYGQGTGAAAGVCGSGASGGGPGGSFTGGSQGCVGQALLNNGTGVTGLGNGLDTSGLANGCGVAGKGNVAENGPGLMGIGGGTGAGCVGIGGINGDGGDFTGNGNGIGVSGQGRYGGRFTGTTGPGVGVWGIGGGNGMGGYFYGSGSGVGVQGIGGASGDGATFQGGSGGGNGVNGIGTGTSPGVTAQAGTLGSWSIAAYNGPIHLDASAGSVAPGPGTLWVDNFPKAFGTISLDGSGNATLIYGYNIQSVMGSSGFNNVAVVLKTPMHNSSYLVMCPGLVHEDPAGPTVSLNAANVGITDSSHFAFDFSNGVVGSVAGNINFVVYGPS